MSWLPGECWNYGGNGPTRLAMGRQGNELSGFVCQNNQLRVASGTRDSRLPMMHTSCPASVGIYTTAVVYGGMPGASSIKIPDAVKEILSCLKVHPRETYGEVIERLVRQTREGVPAGHIPLQYVKVNGTIRELSNPIDLAIEADDDDYIIYNNEYHLLVVAPDLHKGLQEINLQFEENWNDYIHTNEDALTPGARSFRKRLLSLFSEAV